MIDKIFHIADIHIRNLKRHNEYKQVFTKLYKEIKDRKTDNSVIVVAGDIAHSKTEMSPELVNMVADFFENLSDLCDTIVITGNHDCNLNNTYRMDVLSPIIDTLDISNLYYYKDSGVYNHGNVDFVVWSIFDEVENFIKAKDVEGNNVKIGLYHDAVDSARTDVGFKIHNTKVQVPMMEGFDMFLLGDIHAYQYLNDEHTIAYAGSLIQQNHGENRKGHGMLVWDVETRASEFVEIPNDYGYYTLDIIDGEFPVVDDMPKKPRLRIRVANTDNADLKKILTKIRKTYKVDEFTVIRTDTLSQQKVGDYSSSIHYDNIQNVEHQNALIKDYIDRNYPFLESDITQQVQDINRELNSKIPDEEVVRNIRWLPISFEFDNMFSYGEGNKIDFTQMDGVLGLFAPNTSGKSSVFDALSFCIFDKCSRAYKADHIMNNRKDNFNCKFHFVIDSTNYYIEKNARRTKRGTVKVDVDFWKEDGGVVTSLNGEQRRDTNSIVRQYLGSYEDFVFTCLSLQGNNSVFIDKSQSERKDLLAQLMGLNIFDKLYTYGNDEIRETNALLRKFKRDDFTQELADLEKVLEQTKNKLDGEEKTEKELKKELDDFDNKLEQQYEKLHSVDESLDIEQINKQLENNNQQISSIKTTHRTYEADLSGVLNDTEGIKTTLTEYTDIERKYQEWVQRKKERDHVLTEIDKHKVKVEHTLKRLNTAKDNLHFEVNDECSSCLNNVEKFNTEYNNILTELHEQKMTAKSLVETKKTYEYVEQNSHLETQHTEYTQLTEKLNKLSLEKTKLESSINECDTKLEHLTNVNEMLEGKVEEYHTNENKIKENQKTRQTISQLKTDRDATKNEYTVSQESIKRLWNEAGTVDTKIEELESKIIEGKGLENKIEAYQYYLDSVKRDGVPYELITKTIPIIQNEVNNILQQIVDFNMNIEVDGKSINAKLVYEDREWPLEMGSGMEKFISGVAIRVALMNISNLPRPNFLALDEGFGVLDSDNFNSLFMLFQYLKTQFDFIIVISHLDSMRDIVNDFVEIQKVNGFSKINHD